MPTEETARYPQMKPMSDNLRIKRVLREIFDSLDVADTELGLLRLPPHDPSYRDRVAVVTKWLKKAQAQIEPLYTAMNRAVIVGHQREDSLVGKVAVARMNLYSAATVAAVGTATGDSGLIRERVSVYLDRISDTFNEILAEMDTVEVFLMPKPEIV